MGVKIVNYRRITTGANFTSQMSGILAEAINDLGYTNNNWLYLIVNLNETNKGGYNGLGSPDSSTNLKYFWIL